jgi:hypothetical protein
MASAGNQRWLDPTITEHLLRNGSWSWALEPLISLSLLYRVVMNGIEGVRENI